MTTNEKKTTRTTRANGKGRVSAQKELVEAIQQTTEDKPKTNAVSLATVLADQFLNNVYGKVAVEKGKIKVADAIRKVATNGDWNKAKVAYGELIIAIADNIKANAIPTHEKTAAQVSSMALGGLRGQVRALVEAKKEPLPEYPSFAAVEKGSDRHVLTGWNKPKEKKEKTLIEIMEQLIREHGFDNVSSALATLKQQ